MLGLVDMNVTWDLRPYVNQPKHICNYKFTTVGSSHILLK